MSITCLDCGDELKGRADKKFCSDACRNSYNNKFNKDTNNLMKNVNRTLRRNRSILAKLNPNGKSKTDRKTLMLREFDFNYYTNVYTTKTGKAYYFCYEYGYLPLDNDLFALVVKQEYVK